MAFYDAGNKTIRSSAAGESTGSTAGMFAEIDSTQLAVISQAPQRIVKVNWTVGASTIGLALLEHALSTGLGSTALRDVTSIYLATNQTAQYVGVYEILSTADRFRMRLSSAMAAVAGKIEVEPLI